MASSTTIVERPILFSGPMVRAILDGRKTQTRRPVKGDWTMDGDESGMGMQPPPCPLGMPGDRLWVRETFAPRRDVDPGVEPQKARDYALYRADGTSLDEPHWHSYPSKWTASIFMPRWACRIVLEITGVRVERLQSISAADMVAEGATPERPFGTTWREVYTRPPFRFEDDPWVWAIEFRRIEE